MLVCHYLHTNQNEITNKNQKKTIGDVFIKICNEYRNAIRQPLKNHPLADYTRKEIPKIDIILTTEDEVMNGFAIYFNSTFIQSFYKFS